MRRLIINKAYKIDNIAFIFHPAVPGWSVASPLSTRVEYYATLRRDDLDAAIISSEASAKGDPGDRTRRFDRDRVRRDIAGFRLADPPRLDVATGLE